MLDRSQVLDWLEHLRDHVPPLEILELVDLGDAVMVGLPGEEPWDRPTSYQRVKVRDGVMMEIQHYGPGMPPSGADLRPPTREALRSPIHRPDPPPGPPYPRSR